MRLKLPTMNRMRSLPVRVPILLTVLLLALFSFHPQLIEAGPLDDYVDILQRIRETKQKIAALESQADTLAKQISYLDYQIYLTQLEIEAKETEIKLLTQDIGDLTQRLERIGSFLEFQEGTFVARARSAYIADQLSPFDIVLGSEDLDEAIRRIKYLKVLEAQDREVLEQIRDIRTEYDEQKELLKNKKADVEDLKRQIEEKKANLSAQRDQKSYLLSVTRGEESRYRKFLGMLEAERRAIEEALRNLGTKLGPVKAGKAIAVEGNTGCSTGPHVHYEVRTSGNYRLNPCSYVGCRGLWGVVRNGAFYAPELNGILTQGYWFGHHAIDVAYGAGGVIIASADGTAYLAQDPSWFASVCRSMGYPYNGIGYGIVVVHKDGKKTLYWHIRKPGT